MKTTIWKLLTLVVLVLPAAYLAYTWPALPTQIPTHFNAAGAADGFTAKENMWLLCLGLPMGTYLLLTFLPRLDPKRRLDAGTTNYQKLQLLLVALMSGLSLFSLYAALHPAVQPGRGLAVVMGVFFALMGNYLTTVQPNYFVGFKTPWALEFPLIWTRTHRLGGWLFFATGVLSTLLALAGLGEVATGVLVAGLLGTTVAVYAYSYWLYRQEITAAR
ncbi:putative membrane protein [Hymenobacter luteus]|uniref:Membrane protein n=2 Tax=Hymenobacter TaxID=89966 RepID=A0ABR6K0Y7_9BACT|nr:MULTISPECIES: SdpI family protein [Hymenobacter]MBB4602753.1 putative membrane protein [Hymenobacter latericoloratus]MBB6060644.1 putative membrane protein [Hymenobacter luteus]